MSRHQEYELLSQVVNTIANTGWNIFYLEDIDYYPFYLQLYKEDESHRIRLYIWHLTHGGGQARPQHEYRIQVTGINQFEPTDDYKTLALGWWQDIDVFAGFDVRKHLGLLGKSPSLQIPKGCLRQAYVNGLSLCDKGNQEVAIAFRPDFLIEYVRHLEALHNFGQFPEDLVTLDEIIQQPEINDEEIQIIDRQRKTTVVSIRKTLRDTNFRERVLRAYNFQCAVCGIRLKLIGAAHILPVNHEKSTDETRNGIALCALHHRAYDRGLITVDENYSVLLNERQITRLSSVNQAGGLDNFSRNLRPIILLPPAITDRPHIDYIRLANQARGWSQQVD